MLSKKTVNKNVLELARGRIQKAFKDFDHIAVMFSGGKDSTACLNLTLEEAHKNSKKLLPLDVIFSDEEALPYQTEEYVRRVFNRDDVNLRWYCVPMAHKNNCSSKYNNWYHWAPEKKDQWVRSMPSEAITELPFYTGLTNTKLGKIRVDSYFNDDEVDFPNPKGRLSLFDLNGHFFYPPEKYGKVGVIMGIRAQESLFRYRAVTNKKKENYIIKASGHSFKGFAKEKLKLIKPKNIYKIYPIYDWQTEDVWTAPKKLGWDYNHAYDVMDKYGITPYDQRIAPPYHKEAVKSLHMFKFCFPEVWDKMYKRVPGASTASRYGNTELYFERKDVQKPDNISWKEFIKEKIKGYDSKEHRLNLVKQVEVYIKKHYDKTKEPILGKTPHWYTGISWEFLAKIVVNGDFLKRTLIRMTPLKTKDIKEAKKKYYDALEKSKQKEESNNARTTIK